MFIRSLLGGVLFAALVATTVHASQPVSPLERGRTYTAWFYAGETDRLWERLSPAMRQTVGSAEAFRAARAEFADQLGAEQELLDEHITRLPPYSLYIRTAIFEKSPEPLQIRWGIDAEGMIAGFVVQSVQEAAASRFLDYETRTPLRLPFNGAWFVYWGGRTIVENYHAAVESQRFAYDFVVERGGTTHSGDGSENDQYFCFDLPVLAPGDGVVVAAQDGVPDNVPGVMNADQPFGNHVIIDHEDGEFSVLVHLQMGTVQVAASDRVRGGDRLGRCGNSGNSSEPHLHYHLQTTATPGDGEGLPAQFNAYRADGVAVPRGEPRQGQTIEND